MSLRAERGNLRILILELQRTEDASTTEKPATDYGLFSLPARQPSAIILVRQTTLMKLRRMSWSPLWAGQMW
jgi:hypothetical protein